jgi:hypothetical protein
VQRGPIGSRDGAGANLAPPTPGAATCCAPWWCAPTTTGACAGGTVDQRRYTYYTCRPAEAHGPRARQLWPDHPKSIAVREDYLLDGMGAPASGARPRQRTDHRRRGPPGRRTSPRPARWPAPRVPASCMNAFAHPSAMTVILADLRHRHEAAGQGRRRGFGTDRGGGRAGRCAGDRTHPRLGQPVRQAALVHPAPTAGDGVLAGVGGDSRVVFRPCG